MKKLKVKDPWQVRTDMLSKESWLKIRKSKKDLHCTECKVLYEGIDDDRLAMMTIKGKPNRHLCNACGRRYIDELGAVDITKGFKEKEIIKTSLISEIRNYLSKLHKNDDSDSFYEVAEVDYLEESLDDLKLELSEKERLDAIVVDDTPLEEYLVKEYSVIKDTTGLKDTSQIEDYFKANGYDYFDCGQGYCQEEADQIIEISGVYYLVKMEAEIGSSKQDRGDRLYWVENIDSITWEIIDKPQPKLRIDYKIDLSLTVDQAAYLENHLKEIGFIN